MSSIYNLEPQPTASAILHTTLGEIAVELFAKQTPLACRNFLQLALDGYYDDTIFHRLVAGFIVQGGDPTGTGNGGESIYDGGALSGELDPWPMDERRGKNAGETGINFKDEFHSRLKFNRRGLLAMANEGRPDTNGSQFFFTLDKTEELNGKNTLFGRVAGDTIYNLAKIGESEVDEATERPLYPIKISRVEILVNPFDDMKKRSRVAPTTIAQKKAPSAKEKKKRKGGKQLLSFDDEEGDTDMPQLKKAKFDTRIVAADDEEEERLPNASKAKTKKREKPTKETIVEEDAKVAPVAGSDGHKVVKTESRSSDSPLPESEDDKPAKSALERANDEIAALKASMRRTVHSEQATKAPQKTALEAMIPETSTRGRKRRPGGNAYATADDQKALRMLKEFQSRLDKAPAEKETQATGDNDANAGESSGGGEKGEGDGKKREEEEAELCDLHFIANCQSCTSWDKQERGDESDDEGWMSHSLSFAADKLGKDLSNRRKAEEELVVIDPREKSRTLKEERRAGREGRGNGGGGSGRAWDQAKDQARNAKIAQAASLAGRGAK